MIVYKDKRINVINKKRIYLIDKINAYFKEVVKYKDNPTKLKKQLINNFDNQIDESLDIFK